MYPSSFSKRVPGVIAFGLILLSLTFLIGNATARRAAVDSIGHAYVPGPGCATCSILNSAINSVTLGAPSGSAASTPAATFVPQFSQQGPKLVATGAEAERQQGWSISISADGNTAIVGGPANGNASGGARVWTRSGGVWAQGDLLVGSGGVALGILTQGISVAISADGNTAIVGGSADNDYAGAVWVWTRSGGIWTQQGPKLVASDAAGNARQGSSVSVSADGNTAIIGGHTDNGLVGAAWVWTRSGGVWTQQGPKLVGSDVMGNAQQGKSVSLSGDGNTAIIGGSGDNGGAGATWVWTRSGGVWTQQGAKLVSPGGGGQGWSASLSADGNTAIIGAPGYHPTGAGWIWTRSGGVWARQGNALIGSTGGGDGQKGWSVSLSADGNTAIIGGPYYGGAGAAWAWTRSGGVWTEGPKLMGSGAVGDAKQGYSAALSADANTAIIGGEGDNDHTGAAWVFTTAPPTPINPVITWNNPADIVFGTPLDVIQLNATANTSGTFLYNPGPGVVLNAGNNQTLSVDFTPTDTSNFNSASKNVQINVQKAPATITLSGLSQTYNGLEKFAIATTNPAGLNGVTLSYSQNGAAVASPTDAGTYEVQANLDNNNYQASPALGTLVISKATQTITFNSLADKTLGDAPFTVTATASSGLPVSFSIVSGLATISANTITLTDLGVVTVRAAQAGNSNYNAATPVDRSFTVAAPTFQPVVLTPDQVEIKTWSTGGRTYAYLKLLFPNAGYRVTNWGLAVRSGNDFSADAAVEKFTGASIQAVTTTAQIYDLGPLANGTYNFNFKTSGTLTKTLQFVISSTVPPPNPIDDARQFVKQQYRDFLNREADQAGEDFWTDNITKCNDPARRPPDQVGQTVEQCTLRQRETTSGAFFTSPEFQYTGYYVYRMYVGALGRPPKLSEFVSDAQFVGNGIIVNGQLSGAQINQNKAAFAAQFVNCVDATKSRCAEFKAIYDKLSDLNYVDKLFLTTGMNASASDRQALLVELNSNLATGRATVLQKVVDGINVISEGNEQFTTTYGQAFYNSELNRAFVQLEYFSYMKRDPDEAGYAFWLDKLNLFGGNFVNAEMVLAFISSPEYRARFGPP